MSTKHHTPIQANSKATTASINGPLGELDTVITNIIDGDQDIKAAIPDFTNATHDHSGDGTGGKISPKSVSVGTHEVGEVLQVLEDNVSDFAPLDENPNFEPGMVTIAGRVSMSGWLLCNGAAVSRTVYPDLFTAIGEKFGEGNGSSTFNIPDMRGAFPMGAGGDYKVGDIGGEPSVTLTIEQIPHHVHQMGWAQSQPSGSSTSRSTLTPGGGGYYSTETGGSGAHNNLPPFLVVNYFIKY